MSNAMNGTDDMLWNGSKEDGNITNCVRMMKVLDCENGDNETDL
jgi:hypothetical protein